MEISWVFWEETCLIVPKPTNGQIDWNNIHRKSRKSSNLTPRFLQAGFSQARYNILYMLWCICYTYAKAHFLCAGGARLQVFFDVPRALGQMCTVEVQFKSIIKEFVLLSKPIAGVLKRARLFYVRLRIRLSLARPSRIKTVSLISS